jgi:protein phosphatase
MSPKITIAASGKTNVGQVRSTNQDSFLVSNDELLFIVADGMGGHAGGEIASKLCVQEISRYLADNLQILNAAGHTKETNGCANPVHPDARIANTMAHAVNYASTKIYERALEDPGLRGMGTTATVCKIIDDYAYIAHVGDSRLYLQRCGFIYQITNDHSLVSEQVRAGILTKEEAELHHLRNVITRSVGYQEEEDVDTTSMILEEGDVLLMCSDGLHGKISDKEISQMVAEKGVEAVDQLISLANERGGDDNITVVILKIKVPVKYSVK